MAIALERSHGASTTTTTTTATTAKDASDGGGESDDGKDNDDHVVDDGNRLQILRVLSLGSNVIGCKGLSQLGSIPPSASDWSCVGTWTVRTGNDRGTMGGVHGRRRIGWNDKSDDANR